MPAGLILGGRHIFNTIRNSRGAVLVTILLRETAQPADYPTSFSCGLLDSLYCIVRQTKRIQVIVRAVQASETVGFGGLLREISIVPSSGRDFHTSSQCCFAGIEVDARPLCRATDVPEYGTPICIGDDDTNNNAVTELSAPETCLGCVVASENRIHASRHRFGHDKAVGHLHLRGRSWCGTDQHSGDYQMFRVHVILDTRTRYAASIETL